MGRSGVRPAEEARDETQRRSGDACRRRHRRRCKGQYLCRSPLAARPTSHTHSSASFLRAPHRSPTKALRRGAYAIVTAARAILQCHNAAIGTIGPRRPMLSCPHVLRAASALCTPARNTCHAAAAASMTRRRLALPPTPRRGRCSLPPRYSEARCRHAFDIRGTHAACCRCAVDVWPAGRRSDACLWQRTRYHGWPRTRAAAAIRLPVSVVRQRHGRRIHEEEKPRVTGKSRKTAACRPQREARGPLQIRPVVRCTTSVAPQGVSYMLQGRTLVRSSQN